MPAEAPLKRSPQSRGVEFIMGLRPLDEFASDFHLLPFGAFVVVLIEDIARDVRAIGDDLLRRSGPQVIGNRSAPDSVW